MEWTVYAAHWGVEMKSVWVSTMKGAMVAARASVAFLVVAMMAAACKAESWNWSTMSTTEQTPYIDWDGLESAEEAARIRTSKTVLAYMTLETMFPDEKVRALASAAGKGQIAKIERLVAEGVDVNARGTQNATPLFWAMANLSGFTKLLELGANPNIVYGDGGTVMHWAAEAKDPTLLKAALEHGGDPNLVAGMFGWTPLFEPIGYSNIAAMEILLNAGADIDARGGDGDTAVNVAASLGRFDDVYFLLTHGARYDLTNKHGLGLTDYIADLKDRMIPNHELTRWLHKVIEWLREHGVEVEH